MKYKCITNGFKIKSYSKNNPDIKKEISVFNGDVVNCEDEYILKNGFIICHKDSILGIYHFRKVEDQNR